MPGTGEQVDWTQRSLLMTEALRALDPEAEVRFDAASGKVSLQTVLSTWQVVEVLKALGEHAELIDDGDDEDSNGGGCCGCCSH